VVEIPHTVPHLGILALALGNRQVPKQEVGRIGLVERRQAAHTVVQQLVVAHTPLLGLGTPEQLDIPTTVGPLELGKLVKLIRLAKLALVGQFSKLAELPALVELGIQLAAAIAKLVVGTQEEPDTLVEVELQLELGELNKLVAIKLPVLGVRKLAAQLVLLEEQKSIVESKLQVPNIEVQLVSLELAAVQLSVAAEIE
jgi:hypothetical protein